MLRLTVMLILLATAVVFGNSFADALAGGGDAADSFGHGLVLFLHQLLLVYWLGPDIAVFIWSRRVVNTGLGPEQRVAAGRIMTTIDLVPRACLALFLTVAGILTETYGISHPWWQMAGIVLLGPVWLFVVLAAWFREGSQFGRTMTTLDTWLRIALVVGIPLSVAYSWTTGRLADAPWINVKLIILAGIILLGLLMRVHLRRFFDGVEKLAAEGQSVETDQQMASSLSGARRYVHAIWLLLLWAALLGVVKPGEPEQPPPVASTARR